MAWRDGWGQSQKMQDEKTKQLKVDTERKIIQREDN